MRLCLTRASTLDALHERPTMNLFDHGDTQDIRSRWAIAEAEHMDISSSARMLPAAMGSGPRCALPGISPSPQLRP